VLSTCGSPRHLSSCGACLTIPSDHDVASPKALPQNSNFSKCLSPLQTGVAVTRCCADSCTAASSAKKANATACAFATEVVDQFCAPATDTTATDTSASAATGDTAPVIKSGDACTETSDSNGGKVVSDGICACIQGNSATECSSLGSSVGVQSQTQTVGPFGMVCEWVWGRERERGRGRSQS
jgi:hypothetical protein